MNHAFRVFGDSGIERHWRLLRWLDSRRTPPTRDEVVDFCGCERATAYRILAMYRNFPKNTRSTPS